MKQAVKFQAAFLSLALLLALSFSACAQKPLATDLQYLSDASLKGGLTVTQKNEFAGKTLPEKPQNDAISDTEITSNSVAIPEPTANPEMAPVLSKDSVYEKMLNAVDYYASAKGVLRTTFYDPGTETTINYTVNTHGDFMETLNNTASAAPFSLDSYAINGTITRFNVLQRAYVEQGTCELLPVSATPSERITAGPDGKPMYIYRPELSTLSAAMSLLPQQLAFGLLADQTTWEVTGTEEYAGYACTKITGSTGAYGEKFGASQFMALVENTTGILLKMEMYDTVGNMVQFLDTDSIAINFDRAIETITIPWDTYAGYTVQK